MTKKILEKFTLAFANRHLVVAFTKTVYNIQRHANTKYGRGKCSIMQKRYSQHEKVYQESLKDKLYPSKEPKELAKKENRRHA